MWSRLEVMWNRWAAVFFDIYFRLMSFYSASTLYCAISDRVSRSINLESNRLVTKGPYVAGFFIKHSSTTFFFCVHTYRYCTSILFSIRIMV